MDLSRDVPGYSISPHTDTRHKLVTTLFYLPNTTAWPEAGTQFLVRALPAPVVPAWLRQCLFRAKSPNFLRLVPAQLRQHRSKPAAQLLPIRWAERQCVACAGR
jgi:hypothetical protein